MRGKLGLLIGFGAGYVLGSKAGRDRYAQIKRVSAKLRETSLVQNAAECGKNLLGKGFEKLFHAIGNLFSRSRHEQANKKFQKQADKLVKSAAKDGGDATVSLNQVHVNKNNNDK
ncbi:MAG: hypothetical protein Q4C71_03975 [Microbacteriaceae bacterium]|nr:hypothetical protein [Microbacteriaceae bacterium]